MQMIRFDAQNDDKELQRFDEYRNYLICRSGVCSCGWKYCEWVGICPHSDESDFDFSVRRALTQMQKMKGEHDV
jgi:hypothetical protein